VLLFVLKFEITKCFGIESRFVPVILKIIKLGNNFIFTFFPITSTFLLDYFGLIKQTALDTPKISEWFHFFPFQIQFDVNTN